MRILVISPPLVLENYRARWRRLANNWNVPVHVCALVPEKRIASGYGEEFFVETAEETDGHFQLKCVKTSSIKNGKYLIKGLRKVIAEFCPDLIFCVHHEGIRQLLQTIIIRKLFFRKTKLIYFSMTAFPRVRKMSNFSLREILKWAYQWANWWMIRHGTDGALCHYDRIETQMRLEGYRKPILQQTQYGVDPEQFKPDAITGAAIRERYRIRGCVIGFCGRFVPAKGLLEIMEAFEKLEGDCSLLLVGDGELRAEIETWIDEKGFHDRVRITGYVPHTEVQEYFQAMDVFVLGSKETPTYIDTFPLVVAQAMTVGIPVIGSISGAIPYQLNGEGLLFPDGDSGTLRQCLQTLLDEPEIRGKMGKALQERALAHFCVDAMNERFVEFLKNQIGLKPQL